MREAQNKHTLSLSYIWDIVMGEKQTTKKTPHFIFRNSHSLSYICNSVDTMDGSKIKLHFLQIREFSGWNIYIFPSIYMLWTILSCNTLICGTVEQNFSHMMAHSWKRRLRRYFFYLSHYQWSFCSCLFSEEHILVV